MTSARTTITLLSALAFAANAAAAEPKKPAAGALVRTTMPGGWLMEVAGDPQHLLVEIPGFSTKTGRVLVVAAATSAEFAKLEATTATILGADGKTVRQESLRGYRSISADLSPDGMLAGVIAEPWEEGGNRAVLIGFSEKGAIWKRPATDGDVVIAGNGWLAEITPSFAPGSDDDMANEPPSPAAATEKPKGARFFNAAGESIEAPAIGGAVVRAGNGLAAVFGHALHIYDSDLASVANVKLPFVEGTPAASADGSVIAVSDDSVDPAGGMRAALLFDKHGKALGSISIPAAGGIEAALSPEGSAVLATPASLGEESPKEIIEPKDAILVQLADRSGKLRWKHTRDRRTPTEHAGSLSVAANGRRSACGFFASNPDHNPDHVAVFDETGKVIYEAPGEFRAVWLDPSGEWLYTVEGDGLSRLQLSKLIDKTAFPR